MNTKVYEVFRQYAIFDSLSVGIFSTLENATKAAQEIASKEQFKQINDKTWGEEDDYGLLYGVFILERNLE